MTGNQPLLEASLATLLISNMPDAAVTGSPPDTLALPDGDSVSFGVGDRWVYVSASTGPDDSAVEALSAGASAVLNLGSHVDSFRHAVQAVVADENYIPVDLVRWIASRALPNGRPETSEPRVRLTEREREVLCLLARGLSNNEIAHELTISVNTVRTHIHALAMKLDAPSRARIVANARAARIPEAVDFHVAPPSGQPTKDSA
jgi:DNA-binding NarL/FixJ family response regulator